MRTSTRWRIESAGLSLVLMTWGGLAAADDKAVCLAASSDGQSLRDVHKLLDAREKFRTCALPTCPTVVRRDCTEWVTELDTTLPTVVLSFKDGIGADVLAAHITMDGAPFADALTGTAIAVDPGPHTFRFERADGVSVERQLLVGEGQHSVMVAAQLALPQVPRTSTYDARPLGWVLGGVGVAGLIVGGVFGGLAISDKSSGGCANERCTNWGAISNAKTAADVSDVGLIAGGVLAATGAALLLFGHRDGHAASWLTAAPIVGGSRAGLTLRGGF